MLAGRVALASAQHVKHSANKVHTFTLGKTRCTKHGRNNCRIAYADFIRTWIRPMSHVGGGNATLRSLEKLTDANNITVTLMKLLDVNVRPTPHNDRREVETRDFVRHRAGILRQRMERRDTIERY